MAAFKILAGLCLLGSGLALPAPAPEPCLIPPSSSCYCPNTPYSFFSSIYSSEFSYSYYSVDVCSSVGFDNIPDYIPTVLYDDIERMMLEAKCNWLNSFSTYYPPNIAPNIWDLTDDVLTYDFVMVYSGPGVLNTISSLIQQGFSVAVIDEGSFPPALANSMYYRNAMLNSQFVKPYPAYIPGCDIPRNIYVPNCLGGTSIFDSNSWDYGYRGFYDNLSQFDSRFSWDNAYSRYQEFERYEQTTTVTSETEIEVSPCGCVSISTSYRETSVTRSISSVFSELGYSNGFSPLGIDRVPGLGIVPSIGNGDSSLLYPQEIFSRLSSFDLIDLILGLRIERLIYEYGRICGVEVITPYGPKVIYSRYDVILGGSPIPTFELLTRSGFGNSMYLNKFNIPMQVELPYLGQNLMCNPTFLNPFIRFPRGTLINEYVSDYSAMDFMFGGNSLSSISSLSYYNAYLSVRGSSYSNVMMKFYAFTRSMSYYIQFTLSYYFQLDYEMVQYVLEMCESYDILFIAPQLLSPQSMGYIEYGESIQDLRINLGMYQNQEDLYAMIEAIQYIEQISSTSAITSMGGELMNLPFNTIPLSGSFFSQDYLSQVLPYFSVPNLHLAGGGIMGSSYESSVVDTSFYFHNIPNLMYLSSGISPFPIPADSIAFGSLLGRYAYENIMERYNSGFYESFSSSSSYSNTVISNNGLGLDTYSSSSSSSSSYGYDTNTRELGIGGIGSGMSTGLLESGMSTSLLESGMSASEMETMSMGNSMLGGSSMSYNNMGGLASSTMSDIDVSMASSGSNFNSLSSNGLSSSYSASEAEAASYSSDMVSSMGGLTTSQSYDSSYAAAESESASTTLLGGGGMISEYEAAESEASSSSFSSTSMGLNGMSSVSQSVSESSSSYESGTQMIGC